MSNPPIGFVGLGVMGLPMALNLSRAGYSLTVYDKDPAAAARAAESHPRRHGGAVARRRWPGASTIVVTMLPSGKYVQEVALGDDGLDPRLQRGRTAARHLFVRALADPRDRGALAASGVAMVDAPVSGAQLGAQTGELVFMAGGDPPRSRG